MNLKEFIITKDLILNISSCVNSFENKLFWKAEFEYCEIKKDANKILSTPACAFGASPTEAIRNLLEKMKDSYLEIAVFSCNSRIIRIDEITYDH